MTSSFSRPGAVDLSSLASTASNDASAGASWVVDVDESSFNDIVQQSVQYPVLLEVNSPRAGAEQLSKDLVELTNAAQGRWLLARIDVDAQPRLAQALQVESVPMVVAIIGGQPMPLFQGTKDRAEVSALLDQVAQVAVANGMTGRAQPVASAAPAGDQQEDKPMDPRFVEADAAMERGDFAAAVAEFDKVLASAPADAEAIQARAQALLLQRSTAFDPQAIIDGAKSRPDDVDVQLDAADLEVIHGAPAAAFDRIIELIRENRDPEVRDRLRLRLLELFDAVGKADPIVGKARRKLSTALFA